MCQMERSRRFYRILLRGMSIPAICRRVRDHMAACDVEDEEAVCDAAAFVMGAADAIEEAGDGDGDGEDGKG